MATVKKTIKKAQSGKKLLTPGRTRQVADSLDYEAYKKNTGGFAALIDKKIKNRQEVFDMSMKSADKDTKNATRYRTLADQAEAKSKTAKSKMKSGGSTPAWTHKEGKNPTGGLNAKGRASYNAANPGSKLKAPQPEGGPRKRSFCARMSGVKGPAKKPNGEPTRKTLALRKWKC